LNELIKIEVKEGTIHRNGGRECSVEGCEKSIIAKGLCKKHYSRMWRSGTTDSIVTFHGMCGIPEYRIWHAMKCRCNLESDARYYRYGGRGITVCDEWANSFLAFITDMGRRPYKNYQIDRIDNDKGYSRDNCRWTTHLINQRNKSNGKLTMSDARNIRTIYKKNDGRTKVDIGRQFGVTGVMVGSIIKGKAWREES